MTFPPSSTPTLPRHAGSTFCSLGTPLSSWWTGRSTHIVGRNKSVRCLCSMSGIPTAILSPEAEAVMFSDGSLPGTVARAVVWFRIGDLRVRDHPGLSHAAETTSESIVPLFVITPQTPSLVFPVLHRLRESLRRRRADLVLRYARSEREGVLKFATEFDCQAIHVKYDADEMRRNDVEWLQQRLRASTVGAHAPTTDEPNNEHRSQCSVVAWRDSLRELEFTELKETFPDLYPKFLRWRPRVKAQVLPSTVEYEPATLLPGLPRQSESGSSTCLELGNLTEMHLLWEKDRLYCPAAEVIRRYEIDSERVGARPESVGAENTGDDGVLARLSPEDDYGEALIHDTLERMEEYQQVDMARSLQSVLWLGLVSPRRICELVVAYEHSRGRLFRPIYRSGAKTLLGWLDAREFADLMAERDLNQADRTVDGLHRAKFWRWRGILVRYVEEGSGNDSAIGKPAVLLAHGFGASAQHWGRNVVELAKRYHVFAFCNVGFGRSEKPPFVHTQYIWECFTAEFVKYVVGRKVIIAGNSIGGYLSCAFASDTYPSLCAGVALLNAAGKVYKPEEYAQLDSEKTTPLTTQSGSSSVLSMVLQSSSLARQLAGQLLLFYLRLNIRKTLSRVYTMAPHAVTDDLADEIYRNSFDYGALEVISSGFVLPPQRSINELLQAYKGPLLIYQGKFDPLMAAPARTEAFRAIYPSATIHVVDAGHCPHDEVPEKFNSEFSKWIEDSLARRGAENVSISVPTISDRTLDASAVGE